MRDPFDAVIVGSGFGGGMVAHALVRAGWRVLMLERGSWVERGPHNWGLEGAVYQTPHHSEDCGYIAGRRLGRTVAGIQCVGGQSVFYGGVSLRMRAHEFQDSRQHGGAGWPFGYALLEPYYARAEALLDVAGDPDPSGTGDPPRSSPYPHALPPLSDASRLIRDAAVALGHRTFRLPLAMNFAGGGGRKACIRCLTCDAFACAIGAKNDIASAILPPLMASGLTVKADTRALRFVRRGRTIASVECVDTRTGERHSYRAHQFVLAAGALGSPQLVFESGLAGLNGGRAVGRNLVRHCSAIVYGLFPASPNPGGGFHKEIGILGSLQSGEDRGDDPAAAAGAIQQVHSPPVGLATSRVPVPLRRWVPGLVARSTGLLVIGEDEVRPENRVFPHPTRTDRFGAARPVIVSRYTRRDRQGRTLLIARARAILKAAGATVTYVHPIRTFSHAAGTLRMGDDPAESVLEPTGRFRGVDNLTVADASMLPGTGAANPSLTIAAASLHAADHLLARGAR